MVPRDQVLRRPDGCMIRARSGWVLDHGVTGKLSCRRDPQRVTSRLPTIRKQGSSAACPTPSKRTTRSGPVQELARNLFSVRLQGNESPHSRDCSPTGCSLALSACAGSQRAALDSIESRRCNPRSCWLYSVRYRSATVGQIVLRHGASKGTRHPRSLFADPQSHLYRR